MQKPILKKKEPETFYKVLDVTSFTALEIESDLNDLASAGWRLVTSSHNGNRLILEREE